LLIKALKQNPSFVEAYELLGALLKEGGKLDEAEKCLRRAIELNPQSWRAHFNLAQILEAKNLPDAANHHLQLAIQLNPGIAHIIQSGERIT
jgi:tetratricopeptide (TPR) repeat protein